MSLLLSAGGRPAHADLKKGTPPLTPMQLGRLVDAALEKGWKEENARPAPRADDATFLRRAYLDLVGTIPIPREARAFLVDRAVDKRARLIQRLVRDERFAKRRAEIWRRLLVPPTGENVRVATQLDPYLTRKFKENVPYHQLATELLTAKGGYGNEPVMYFIAVGNTPTNLAASTTRSFLGIRIGCAQCHDHPFASWKQQDFWGMAAFFAGVNNTENANFVVLDGKESTIRATGSGKEYSARFLTGETASIEAGQSPRQVLAKWMTSPTNRYFAANTVNRVWQELFGAGLVSPVDDLDLVPLDKRPPLLEELARRFVAANYDMRWLVEGLAYSRLYQHSSEKVSADDNKSFTHMSVKVLAPEQIYNALEQSLQLPKGVIPGSSRFNGERIQFIQRLEGALGDTPSQYRAGIPQALTMMNGSLVARGCDLADGRTAVALADAPFLEPKDKLDTLFLMTLVRYPRTEEKHRLLELCKPLDAANTRQFFVDLHWALLNSPEFVLNH